MGVDEKARAVRATMATVGALVRRPPSTITRAVNNRPYVAPTR